MSDINEVLRRLERAVSELPGSLIAADVGALLSDHARLQADAERLDWMDTNHFTAYRQCDAIDSLSQHCVVVAESIIPRRGCVNNGIRGAIDEAKAMQK